MATLQDILANAQHGDAINLLGKAYNLTPEQTEAAVTALLPAISMGPSGPRQPLKVSANYLPWRDSNQTFTRCMRIRTPHSRRKVSLQAMRSWPTCLDRLR